MVGSSNAEGGIGQKTVAKCETASVEQEAMCLGWLPSVAAWGCRSAEKASCPAQIHSPLALFMELHSIC